MPGRFSRPGSPSRAKFTQPGHDAQFSKQRVAWTSLHNTSVVVMRYDDEEEETPEKGDIKGTPTVNLTFPHTVNRSKTRTINLTSLTYEELAALKEVVDLAFDLAEPIVRFRDKVAEDESKLGNDSYTRLYRAVPEVFVRQGAQPEDLQELRSRFNGALEVSSDDGDTSGGVGTGRPDVAPSGAASSSGQDDTEESDES